MLNGDPTSERREPGAHSASPQTEPRGGPVDQTVIVVDEAAPRVARITLNRPEKRNALNATLRREVLAATRELDRTSDVRVTIIRGAGSCFSAGYDLSHDPGVRG